MTVLATSGLPVVAPLVVIWVGAIWLWLRREAIRKATVERHRESVRLPESWLDRRERETRTLTEVDDA